MRVGSKVMYKGNEYTIVSAETEDRWWIQNNTMDIPMLVEECELRERR